MSFDPIRNALRWRAILQHRAAVALFHNSDGMLSRAGEQVLSDLRDFCFAQKSTFDPDPAVMARREGRREVWLRLTQFLNLDEHAVQILMEVDNGD